MKTNYLLPASLKNWGWFILIPFTVLGVLVLINDWEPDYLTMSVPSMLIDELFVEKSYFGMVTNNILNEICAVLVIIGGLLVAFSRQYNEDEFIASIRLKSLVWATYLNYAILIIALILVHEFSFFWVMIFNMFTMLIFFIILFHWNLVKLKKSTDNAE